MKHFLASAREALAYPERAVHRTVLVSLVLLVGVSNLLSVPLIRLLRPEGLQSVAGFLIAALSLELTLLVFVAFVRLVRDQPTIADPWPALRRVPEQFVFGLLAGPALFLVSAVVQLAMAAAFEVRQTQLADLQWIREAPPAQFLLLFGVVALVAPVAEEWYFRGYVFRAYQLALGPVWAFLVSAALFSVLHLNLPAAPPIFAMGLVLGWLYYRTGSLVPGMVAHGFNNATAFLLLYYVPLPG